MLARHLPERPRGRVILLGAGKSAAVMAAAVEAAWPDAPIEGLVVTRYAHGYPTRRVRVLEASHPVPDAAGARAAAELLEVARGAALAGETMILARLPLPQLPARPFALPTPVPTTVTLSPGGNCFNLNSVAMGPVGRTLTRPLGVEQLARLLTLLDVPQAESLRIAAATADWVDVDQQPGSGGADGRGAELRGRRAIGVEEHVGRSRPGGDGEEGGCGEEAGSRNGKALTEFHLTKKLRGGFL